MSDDKPEPDVLPPVCANIVFDLTNPEGERRLREMLDASKLRAVLWNLVHGEDGIFNKKKLVESLGWSEEYSKGWDDALDWVLMQVSSLCHDHNVDLED